MEFDALTLGLDTGDSLFETLVGLGSYVRRGSRLLNRECQAEGEADSPEEGESNHLNPSCSFWGTSNMSAFCSWRCLPHGVHDADPPAV